MVFAPFQSPCQANHVTQTYVWVKSPHPPRDQFSVMCKVSPRVVNVYGLCNDIPFQE